MPITICYGMSIRLRHNETGALLASLPQNYRHANSSMQQIVGGSAKRDQNSLWLVKPPHDQREQNLDGQQVHHGATFRLEHVATQHNLHTHDAPAPLTGPHQREVTAFLHQGPGIGDRNDDWSLQLQAQEPWQTGMPFRLRHVLTHRLLHSHGLASPNATAGLYEVTAVDQGDINDLFTCIEAHSPARVFKILAIDGGGIKGLYTAAALARLERALRERHQQRGMSGQPPRINQHFDLIAGTSTGAIIASALACGKSAEEILNLYRRLGPAIFPDRNKLTRAGRTLRQILFGARYSHSKLRSYLDEFLPNRRFSSSENYLVIPVTNLKSYTPRIFKTRHSPQNQDNDDFVASIALASASAPTYFPICPAPDVINGLYADGGLYANNPALVALIEALRVFVGESSLRKEFDEVWMLSLGNFGSPQGFRKEWMGLGQKVNTNRSMLGWMTPQCGNLPLLGVLMDSQAAATQFSVGILNKCIPAFTHFHRCDARNGKTPRATPDADLTRFSLADACDVALNDLEGYGSQDGQTDATDPDVLLFFDAVRSPPRFYYPQNPQP